MKQVSAKPPGFMATLTKVRKELSASSDQRRMELLQYALEFNKKATVKPSKGCR